MVGNNVMLENNMLWEKCTPKVLSLDSFFLFYYIVSCFCDVGCCRQQSLGTCTSKRQHENYILWFRFKSTNSSRTDGRYGFNINVQSRSLQGNTVVVNWTASYIKTAKHVLMIFFFS